MAEEAVVETAKLTLNKEQISRAFNVSKPTVDNWIENGMPFVSKGTNGKSYEFDLDACIAWKKGQDQKESREAAERDRMIGQTRLDLMGSSFQDLDLSIDPKQYKELLNLARERRLIEEQMGRLVRVSDVESALMDVLRAVSEQLQALPDFLEKRCFLAADHVARVQDQIDIYQASMVEALNNLEFLKDGSGDFTKSEVNPEEANS
ncbi:DUF1441 family protein [Kiloniella laminariae]|uniref:DUF1441 family protein n=1 Tax=Kiloniella laminariae TaxID=454162 RepID=UPI00036DAC41|nr:DUF1441 family protein [Kiloniella laminariae]